MKKKIKKIFSLLITLAGILTLQGAAHAAVDPALIVPPPVRIFIADGALKPIELRSLGITGEVVGNVSNTVIDMAFYNPNPRVLEGELQFPLLDNQTVTAFSLEMDDGKMRDAVPVEKNKGRQVFEEIVRRGVDPALLEMTDGNNFKLRVYPLPPGKARRVRVVITELLPEGKDGLIYRVPLEYGQKIDELELSLKIAHSGKPLIKNSPFDGAGFENKNGVWVYGVNSKNAAVSGMFAAEMPLMKNGE
ncbi:MAG: hypothetical protein FWG09_05010, partial [Synergistaceae bacterium]|nr:hypothetical protein [Synergistaceae bacterium]